MAGLFVELRWNNGILHSVLRDCNIHVPAGFERNRGAYLHDNYVFGIVVYGKTNKPEWKIKMDGRMRNSLDNWITGNDGNDEFADEEPNPMLDTIFTLGVVAYQNGDPLDSCPYTEPNFKQAWVSGWMDVAGSTEEE